MLSFLHDSVKNISCKQVVDDAYGMLHHDVDLLLHTAKEHSMTQTPEMERN